MKIGATTRRIRPKWLWIAPYLAIGVFALSMLTLTAMLQTREARTAQSAFEGDMQWAERTIEARMLSHQDFLAGLGREIEQNRLTRSTFAARTAAYLQDNPDIIAILRLDADERVAWVSPETTPAARIGDSLPDARRAALQEALAGGRFAYSHQYADTRLHHVIDLYRSVQHNGHSAGALVAVHSLENLLNATLPDSFSTRYSLTLEDDSGREIISNANIAPTDRATSGLIRLTLLDGRLGLRVMAYRTGGAWATLLPTILILLMTAITASTLVQLRKNALRRAENEEQLRAAYAFRQAMSESLLTAMRAIDMEGRITYVNKAFCNMVGWSEKELLGMTPPFPYWPPEEAERLNGFLDQSLAGEAPLGRSEMRVMHRDGTRIDVSVYVSPLLDAGGQQQGWMVAMNDITEQKRIRDELRQAQDRFITVVDGLDSAVHVADAGSEEILFANRAFRSQFGFEAVGRRAGDLIPALIAPPGQLSRDPAGLKAHELPRELFDGELFDEARDRWYHLHDRAIRWVDGRTVRVRIATDITAKRNIDQFEREQQKRVEESSRLITLGEMASSLAHELNQPLAAIANYCAGCIRRLESGNYRPDDLLGALRKANEQAQRAGKIIHRMRDMVKKGDPQLHPVALRELIDETLSLAGIEARRRQAMIAVNLPGDLPDVVADRIMIEQVLLNLVKNGLEAMDTTPSGRRQLSITARVLDERLIEIAIADCGCGLAEKDLEKVFAPFYTTKAEGLGIGLAICRSMVEFHQGRLWAESRPEGGTIFKFTLPREN